MRIATLLALAILAAPGSGGAAGEPATLVVANRALITFRATVVGSDPAERVRAAHLRIDTMPQGALGEPISTQTVTLGSERGFAILVGGRLAYYVVEGDAEPLSGGGAAAMAAASAERLGEALRAWRDQRSGRVLLRGLLLRAAATAILLLALAVLVRVRRAAARVLAEAATRAGVALGHGRIDVGPVLAAAVRGVLFVTFWALVALLGDLWLTYVLGRFPVTAPWADVLTGRVVSVLASVGLAMLRSIPGLVTVVVIMLIARFAARFLHGIFDRIERGTLTIAGLYAETVPATRRIAVALLWLVALAASYPYIPGSSSDAFKGLSLLVGVMLSLGSTGLVSQGMSGLAVIYSRALTVGDTVRVGEIEGVVTEVGLLSTKIATVPGEEVTVPNSVVVGGAVRNFTRLSRGAGPLVTTRATIGYDAPWRQVEALLVGAAGATPGLRREPAPFVLQRGLGDFYVEYELVAHLEAEPAERPRILSDLHARIQDAFNEAGVQIMSPHFVVQPPEPVVVPRERWEGAPPALQRRRG